MTPYTEKTMLVAEDVRTEVLSLFGTVPNVSAKLRLPISYGTLYQALRGLAVRPEDAEAIEDAWRKWKQHYIRGLALGLMIDLNDFERVSREKTDQLADDEIEEWTRRLRPTKTKRRVDL